jgi:hypothetical protein
MRPIFLRHGWLLLFLPIATACGGSRFTTTADDMTGADAAGVPIATAGDAGADADGMDAAREAGAAADDMDADHGDVTDRSPDAQGGLDAATDSPGDAPDDTGIGTMDSGLQDGAVDASAEACVPVVFFLDGDGDHYGGTTSSKGCAPPDSRAWVTTGGDCDDSNPTVNPGQAGYFDVGYVPTGQSALSFDYNCDNHESESGSPPKAACKTTGLTCGGSGYVAASPARSGSMVDPFCGSAQAVTCATSSLSCVAGAPYATSPITCH